MHEYVVFVHRDVGRKRFFKAQAERFIRVPLQKPVVIPCPVSEALSVLRRGNAGHDDQVRLVCFDRFRTVLRFQNAVCARFQIVRASDPHRDHLRFAHALRNVDRLAVRKRTLDDPARIRLGRHGDIQEDPLCAAVFLRCKNLILNIRACRNAVFLRQCFQNLRDTLSKRLFPVPYAFHCVPPLYDRLQQQHKAEQQKQK